MLLWKIDAEPVEDSLGVTSDNTIKATLTVHDDEAELFVGLQKVIKWVYVELPVADVEGLVEWPWWLEVHHELLFFAFVIEDGTAEDAKTIWWGNVELTELLDGRGDGSFDRLTVHSVLNVGSSTKFIGKFLTHSVDGIVWWDKNGNHGSAITTSVSQEVDLALDAIKFDWINCLLSTCLWWHVERWPDPIGVGRQNL